MSTQTTTTDVLQDIEVLPKKRSYYVRKLKLTEQKTEHQIPNREISTSYDMVRLIEEIHAKEGDNVCERFYVVYFNQANRAIGYTIMSQGGITGTVADPRLILAGALCSGAVSIAISHNHPSGALKPSRQDEEITAKIKNAARFFDIKVLDHVIVSEVGHFSFNDEGIL